MGRTRLDAVASWFKSVKRPTSEVVIAAFTDAPADGDLAQILTQEQADAVKNYLVSKHKISSSGWFSSGKVAYLGRLRHRGPRGLPAAAAPTRRIEVIVFTPQA
ncbi:MAG: OmpA family protein [Isosphaeraceae bacterium]